MRKGINHEEHEGHELNSLCLCVFVVRYFLRYG
jgi:hypothetical protein